MGEPLMGLQARLMSQALRKLTANIKRSNTLVDLHQPDPHEDRRHVRQSRDHHRRQRAQVLRLGAHRHPPHRLDQEGRRGDRQRDARQGGEEQGRAAVPAGANSTSSTARASRAKARSSSSACCTASSRSPAPGTPTRATGSARARTTRASICREHPEIAEEIEAKIRANVGVRRGGAAQSPTSRSDAARRRLRERAALRLLTPSCRERSRVEHHAQACAPLRAPAPKRSRRSLDELSADRLAFRGSITPKGARTCLSRRFGSVRIAPRAEASGVSGDVLAAGRSPGRADRVGPGARGLAQALRRAGAQRAGAGAADSISAEPGFRGRT